ncbi:MAG: stage II sporulation protein M [Planctomycetota bacterium]|nr:MAG: stage II sporulation protein M [Planctomycetota bacterium]
MNTTDLLASRKADWKRLEQLCDTLSTRSGRDARRVLEFSQLYRAACADLALAEAYQLPQETVEHLHRLVGKAHNVLYRKRSALFRRWFTVLFRETPPRLLFDGVFWVVFVLFWSTFLGSMYLAYRDTAFAEAVAGAEALSEIEAMYSEKPADWDYSQIHRAGFYIQHNIGIALNCFALGLLMMVPGALLLLSNSILLGTLFGHMSSTQFSGNFFEFVTAHGPFELTGIVLAAACGIRLGYAIVSPGKWTRRAALYHAMQNVAPKLVVAVAFFVFAAFIEGLISPSALPYAVKFAVAVVSTVAICLYIFGLGLVNRRHARSH